MNIGVFLLIEPFASVEVQLQKAKEMGFNHADITDTNAGGSMLGSAGFSPTVSLDDNPFDVLRLFEKYEIEPLTVCAHAALLEPSNPGKYGTSEIMKAIKFAAAIGIRDVVTTETDPRSEWAENLTYDQKVLVLTFYSSLTVQSQIRLKAFKTFLTYLATPNLWESILTPAIPGLAEPILLKWQKYLKRRFIMFTGRIWEKNGLKKEAPNLDAAFQPLLLETV